MFDAQSLREHALKVPAVDLPALIGALAEAAAIANRRLLEPTQQAPTGEPGELLCAEEMARQLSIKPSWLLEQARQGRVPHVRLGKYVRFNATQVLKSAESPND